MQAMPQRVLSEPRGHGQQTDNKYTHDLKTHGDKSQTPPLMLDGFLSSVDQRPSHSASAKSAPRDEFN